MMQLLGRHQKRITIIEPNLAGHGFDQLSAIRDLLSESGIASDHKMTVWPHWLTRNPVLFPSLDGFLLVFLLVAPIRALFMSRTVAIWHRPKSSTGGRGVKQYAKRFGARLIKHVPLVAIISVQPPELQRTIGSLVTDWIYQSAWWHKPSKIPQTEYDPGNFEETIRRYAGERPILIYLGYIDRAKGFEFFVDLFIKAARCSEALSFVAAGPVRHDTADAAERFVKAGGLLIDRYITNCEFLAGIDLADWVWACYRPDNDQNSGIFGLAYQAGSRVIVRNDSFVARLAVDLEYPIVEVQYGDVNGAIDAIRVSRLLKVEKPKDETISMMKERTRERLLRYLGFGLMTDGKVLA
jgi:hypothetical protein